MKVNALFVFYTKADALDLNTDVGSHSDAKFSLDYYCFSSLPVSGQGIAVRHCLCSGVWQVKVIYFEVYHDLFD